MLAGEGCFITRSISTLCIRRNWGRALPVYHYPHPGCCDNAPKAHQHEHTETQEPSYRHSFLVRQHTPDGSLIVLGLDLHESEHPVKKMPTDVANYEIDTWLRLWGDNHVCPYTLFRRKPHGFETILGVRAGVTPSDDGVLRGRRRIRWPSCRIDPQVKSVVRVVDKRACIRDDNILRL